jgi:FkbM family methyltransferase
MFRRAVERATRGVSFRRRLPETLGGNEIYVSPSAGLRYLFRPMREIDPVLCSLAREFVRPGDVVWDLGANVGLFSFVAAYLAGPSGNIIAVEPDLWLVQLLRRSRYLQPASCAPVQIVPVAVAATVDLRVLNIACRSRSANFLAGHGSTQSGGIAEEQTVVTVSLDWLADRLPPPRVLKVDVEGAELEVLVGGGGVLSRHYPVIICEVANERSNEVTALLQERGYRIYDGDVPQPRRQELDRAPWTTVALPPGPAGMVRRKYHRGSVSV